MRAILTEKQFIEVELPNKTTIKGHLKEHTRMEINLEDIFKDSNRIPVVFNHNIFKNNTTDIIGVDFIDDVKLPIKVFIEKRKIDITGINPQDLKEVEFMLDLNNQIQRQKTVYILSTKVFEKGGFIFPAEKDVEQKFFSNTHYERNMFRCIVEKMCQMEGLNVFKIDRSVKYKNDNDMMAILEFSHENNGYNKLRWIKITDFIKQVTTNSI